MKIYHYHPQTKEYAGSSEARLDPLESKLRGKDVYLIPAMATTMPPPELQVNFARCFVDGEWAHIEDNRGVQIFSKADGSETSMVDLGPIPESHTKLMPCAFPKWDGNKWIEDPIIKAEAVKENLIQAEMQKILRDQAISNLKSRGEL